jgi:hypothetical protein
MTMNSDTCKQWFEIMEGNSAWFVTTPVPCLHPSNVYISLTSKVGTRRYLKPKPRIQIQRHKTLIKAYAWLTSFRLEHWTHFWSSCGNVKATYSQLKSSALYTSDHIPCWWGAYSSTGLPTLLKFVNSMEQNAVSVAQLADSLLSCISKFHNRLYYKNTLLNPMLKRQSCPNWALRSED